MSLRSFKNQIREYFSFTNREKKPILLFVSLIIILLIMMAYIKFKPDTTKTDFSAFEKEIDAFEKQLEQDSILAAAKKTKYEERKNSAFSAYPAIQFTNFNFNPNHLADSLWLKLGIRERTVKTIKNYESKGGKFRKKEDLKKIYGFNEKDYTRLEPYIVIPVTVSEIKRDSSFKKPAKEFYKPTQPLNAFDLNSVSSEELKILYGIGDVKANSIVKYRSMLGGFFMKEQLQEVYGIDSALYESIKDYLDVKTKNLRMININTAYEPGLRHPYISKQLAVMLVNYRKMHGNFKNKDEIRKLPLINDELYRKLAPYLSLE